MKAQRPGLTGIRGARRDGHTKCSDQLRYEYITKPRTTTSHDIDTVLTSAACLAEEARNLAVEKRDRRLVRFAFEMHALTVALHALQAERSVARW